MPGIAHAFVTRALVYTYVRRRNERQLEPGHFNNIFPRAFGRGEAPVSSSSLSKAPMLSRRGVCATAPALPYLDLFVRGLGDAYDPVERPAGVISMVIAENRLNAAAGEAALRRAATAMPPDREVVGYTDMCGLMETREALLDMAVGTFLRGVVPREALQARSLVVSSGCGALVGHLAMLLGDVGAAVLLPTPTYASLYNDFQTLAGVVVVDVITLADDGFRVHVAALEAAHAAASAAGHLPAVVMLLHPSNPMGHTMAPAELIEVVEWCGARGLHCIVDEVYANSVYDAEPPAAGGALGGEKRAPRSMDELFGLGGGEAAAAAADADAAAREAASCHFDSVVSVLWRRRAAAAAAGATEPLLPPHVHVLWGLSKDWGLSGARLGCLYTCNEALVKALSNVNYFTTVSNHTQAMVAHLMRDAAWRDEYLAENRRLLRFGRNIVTGTLDDLGLQYHLPSAGMFVWMDLRPLLQRVPSSDAESGSGGADAGAASPPSRESPLVAFTRDPAGWAAEEALTASLFAEAKLIFTPGRACHASEPGFYRCCFAYPWSMTAVAVAMERLRRFVAARRSGAEGAYT